MLIAGSHRKTKNLPSLVGKGGWKHEQIWKLGFSTSKRVNSTVKLSTNDQQIPAEELSGLHVAYVMYVRRF